MLILITSSEIIDYYGIARHHLRSHLSNMSDQMVQRC